MTQFLEEMLPDMNAASPSVTGLGLGGPLLVPLLRFNQLPSMLVHPQQSSLLAAPQGLEIPLAQRPGVLTALHRRWSARLLQRLGDAAVPVLDITQAALPLAVADTGVLRRLARELGLALLGRELRRVIVRDEVLALRQAFSTDELAWALDDAAALHPGLHDTQTWLQTGWAQAPEQLGTTVLAQAWHDAPPPLAQRANWRLPPEALTATARDALGLTPTQARTLCLQRLQQTEPVWLSYFPVTH